MDRRETRPYRATGRRVRKAEGTQKAARQENGSAEKAESSPSRCDQHDAAAERGHLSEGNADWQIGEGYRRARRENSAASECPWPAPFRHGEFRLSDRVVEGRLAGVATDQARNQQSFRRGGCRDE